MAGAIPISPEVKAALTALKGQYSGPAHVKVFRLYEDGRTPEMIPFSATETFHRVDWNEIIDLEGWLLRSSKCGPGYRYQIAVHTEDGAGHPSKKPAQTLITTMLMPLQTAAAIAAVAQQQAAVSAVETARIGLAIASIDAQQALEREGATMVEAIKAGDEPKQLSAADRLADVMSKLTQNIATFQAAQARSVQVQPVLPPVVAAPLPPVATNGLVQGMQWLGNGRAVIPGLGIVRVDGGDHGGGGTESGAVAALKSEIEALKQNTRAEADRLREELRAAREAALQAKHEADRSRDRADQDARFAALTAELRAVKEAKVNGSSDDRFLQMMIQQNSTQQQMSASQIAAQQAQADRQMVMLQTSHRAAMDQQEKMIAFLKESGQTDMADQLQKIAAASSEVMQANFGMIGQLARAIGQPPEQRAKTAADIITAPGGFVDKLMGFGAALLGAAGGGNGASAPASPPASQPQLPAPQDPASAQREAADVAVGSARIAARRNDLPTAGEILTNAFQRYPFLMNAGEDNNTAARRWLAGHLPPPDPPPVVTPVVPPPVVVGVADAPSPEEEKGTAVTPLN